MYARPRPALAFVLGGGLWRSRRHRARQHEEIAGLRSRLDSAGLELGGVAVLGTPGAGDRVWWLFAALGVASGLALYAPGGVARRAGPGLTPQAAALASASSTRVSEPPRPQRAASSSSASGSAGSPGTAASNAGSGTSSATRTTFGATSR